MDEIGVAEVTKSGIMAAPKLNNMTARPTPARLKTLCPNPPNISLATTIAKNVPIAIG